MNFTEIGKIHILSFGYSNNFTNLWGWTQEEIAEKVGITRQRVQQIANFIHVNKICNELQTFLSLGKTMEWIAEHYSIDMQLAREGKDGQKKVEKISTFLKAKPATL